MTRTRPGLAIPQHELRLRRQLFEFQRRQQRLARPTTYAKTIRIARSKIGKRENPHAHGALRRQLVSRGQSARLQVKVKRQP